MTFKIDFKKLFLQEVRKIETENCDRRISTKPTFLKSTVSIIQENVNNITKWTSLKCEISYSICALVLDKQLGSIAPATCKKKLTVISCQCDLLRTTSRF